MGVSGQLQAPIVLLQVEQDLWQSEGLAVAGNWTKTARLSCPHSSHYTSWAIPTYRY
jgi:hypothetical protein